MKKYVEASKGSNLFFTIYKNRKTGEHLIDKNSSISFGDVVNLMKEGLPLTEEKEGYDSFFLSPGTLVYLLDDGDVKLPKEIKYERVYKCVSFTKRDAFFIPANISSPVLNKQEFGALNKQERDSEGDLMVKARCIPLRIDRLGRII